MEKHHNTEMVALSDYEINMIDKIMAHHEFKDRNHTIRYIIQEYNRLHPVDQYWFFNKHIAQI